MDQGVRTVNAEQFHPLIAGTDDRTGRGIHCDNLRGKDSCDAGRRSGKRNGVCWKNATLDAADVRVGQIRVQDAEAGAVVASERRVGMLCSGARGGVCERGSYFSCFHEIAVETPAGRAERIGLRIGPNGSRLGMPTL
jgi:hypothetical protein